MLKTSSYADQPLQRLIEQIVSEQSQFERELRSVAREKMVLPVALCRSNGFPSIHAFTRNLSPNGMSVIAEIPFNEKTVCKARMHRLGFDENLADEVLSECRWCKPFGQGYWVSGWKFLRRSTS